MKRRRFWPLLMALIGVLVLAGCQNGQTITAADVIAKMKDTMTKTTDAHLVVSADLDVQAMQTQKLNGQATVEVWHKAPDSVKMEVKSSTFPGTQGALLVKTATDLWAYLPEQNTVYKGSLDKLGIPMTDQILTAMTGDLQMFLDLTDAKLLGSDTVAGKDTYKLELTPKPPKDGQATIPINGKATIWVEKDRWLPLKVVVDGGFLGTGSMTVQSFETNQGIADSVFQFTPPSGAKVIDGTAAAAKPQTMTLDEAKAAAGFKLLVPSYVPNGAQLSDVYKMEQAGLGQMIVLNYNHVPNGFTVAQGKSSFDLAKLAPPNTSKETVTVRGVQGTLLTGGGQMSGTFLSWTENGVGINIAGTISKEEVVKIANSLN